MLVVLSEFNCLKALNNYEIYPDKFYTDFELFKNHSVSFMDADILIFLIGNCAFNKRNIIETYKLLLKRSENKDDSGVKSITIITDDSLPQLDKYYKFIGDLQSLTECSHWKVLKPKNILSQFKSAPQESDIFLTAFDSGDTNELRKKCIEISKHEDEYMKLIIRPNITEMLKDVK